MLARGKANARAVHDHGVQAGVNDGLARHRNAVVAVGDVGAHEDDARARRRRPNRQPHPAASVHPDPGDDGRGDDGAFVMVASDRQT